MIDDQTYEAVERKRSRVKAASEALHNLRPSGCLRSGHQHPYTVPSSGNLASILRRPDIAIEDLLEHYSLPPVERMTPMERRSLELEIKYEGYVARQKREAEKLMKREQVRIPPAFPLEKIPGLRREVVEILRHHRPETLGEAYRIQGITPAAILLIGAFIERWNRNGRI